MKLKTTAIFLSGILLSGVALADQSFTAHGRVIHSIPVYKTIEIKRESRHCGHSRYPSRNSYSSSGYRTDGHKVKRIETSKPGKFDNMDKQTHAKHGERFEHDFDRNGRHQSHPDRCDSGHPYKHKRVLKGFEVTYRYKGDIYHTFTKFRPGRHIRLNISISPQY